MGARPSRRTRFLVDKRSQIYLSLLVVLYMVIYSAVLIAIILFPSVFKLTRDTTPLEIQYEASREFLFLDQRVVPAILVVMCLVALHFMVITHRIFGPLVRFKRVIAEWAEGFWPRPFKARPKDFHHDLFATFNMTALGLKEDLETSKNILGPVLADLEKAGMGAQLPPGQAARLAAQVREAIGRIGRFT